MLAQQASVYDVDGHNLHIQEKLMHEYLEFSYAGIDKSTKLTALVGLADTLMDVSQLAQPTGPVGLADFSCAAAQSAKLTGLVGLANSLVADLANLHEKLSNWPSGTSSDVGADLCDWRTPLLAYLRDPSAKVDKKCSVECFQVYVAK
jgi:hypothetical protein